jgi:hypothetical protein
MTCGGLHCSGCAGGAGVPVAALLAFEGVTWVAAHLVEVAAVSAACGVLAFAAMAALIRRGDRRDARQLAGPSLLITRPDAAPLPSPARRELPPVVNNWYVIADAGTAARVIRQAVTNTQLPPGQHEQGPA